MSDHAHLATPEDPELLRKKEANEAAAELARYLDDVRRYGRCVGWEGRPSGCGAVLYPHCAQDDYVCNDYPECVLP